MMRTLTITRVVTVITVFLVVLPGLAQADTLTMGPGAGYDFANNESNPVDGHGVRTHCSGAPFSNHDHWVDLSVSLEEPVVVPDVVAFTEADASLILTHVGLVVGTVTYEYSNTIQAGLIMSQHPAGGTLVPPGSSVDLVVSLGKPIVPDVVGMRQADANSAITAVDDLTVGDVTYSYSETATAGSVISQDPVGGTSVPVGSSVDLVVSLGQPPLIVSGGNRLVELQNNDGGWDLPLDDGDPNSGSDPETFASVAMGLAHAYRQNQQTSDANMLAALEKAKTFLLSKTDNFVVTDGVLAVELDGILGGTTCADYVSTNFYDKLEAGTYYDARSGAVHDTNSYIQTLREGAGNLAAWDLGLGLHSAYVIGANTTEWVAGVKAEIDELDGSQVYDVLGLAGAVFGLASVGEDHDPQAGEHAAASSLSDLAEILAGYQLGTGGFTWNKGFMQEDMDEMLQETVFGLMALNEFDRTGYFAEITDAGSYLQSVQLVTGGWENYTTSGENNEITGGALWGIVTGIPVPADFDEDGDVDLVDFAILGSAWLTDDSHIKWNPDCDISVPADNYIDWLDLDVLGDNWLVRMSP